MSKTTVFTIASQNYIAYARALLKSVAVYHPEFDRYLLLVDEPDATLDLSNEGFSVVLAKDIGIECFDDMAFKYDIMELNTAVKPFFMSWLLQKGCQKVIYFDPDIMLFGKLVPILESLETHSIVITPHITNPIPYNDKCIPGERDYLSTGTYNLGFIAVAQGDETAHFLKWWSERCLHECFSEMEAGYFVDQKWINLVPGMFSSVKILRNPGCNMAYWNLHERILHNGLVNNEFPLIFFHFSGIDPAVEGQLSKYQNRYTLPERPDLQELFSNYRKKLVSCGYYETTNLPYAYDRYDNGNKIGPLARRMYVTSNASTESPFKTGPGTYYAQLECNHLLERTSTKKYTKDNTVGMKNMLDWLFVILARLIGASKYYALMKYLRYVSIIRRQGFLFKKAV